MQRIGRGFSLIERINADGFLLNPRQSVESAKIRVPFFIRHLFNCRSGRSLTGGCLVGHVGQGGQRVFLAISGVLTAHSSVERVSSLIPSQIVADGQQACIESVFKERIMLKYIHLYTINSGGHFQEFAVANWANCKKNLTARDAKEMRGVFNHETDEKDEIEDQ